MKNILSKFASLKSLTLINLCNVKGVFLQDLQHKNLKRILFRTKHNVDSIKEEVNRLNKERRNFYAVVFEQ